MKKEQIALVKERLESYRVLFENYLLESVSLRKKGVPDELFEAMEYSLAAGGKRLRPVLCIAAAERCGCMPEDALPMAMGVEMFHTASLIHDDLPCMDDDDMRRGKPSNHKVFGETMAVLAGDSLLTQSLEYPLHETRNASPDKLLRAMRIFSQATGPSGVCGGQVLDMDNSQKDDPAYVRKIASLKTGALIRAAALCGAALGTDNEKTLERYYDYGSHIGAAFQIVDDILDVTSTQEQLGKTPGKDAEQGKITHVTVFGLDAAKKMAEDESAMAKDALSGILPENDFLILLPEYLVYRTY